MLAIRSGKERHEDGEEDLRLHAEAEPNQEQRATAIFGTSWSSMIGG